MKKFILILAVILFSSNLFAQRRLKIGDTEYIISFPIKAVEVTDEYTYTPVGEEIPKKYRYPRITEDLYIGVHFLTPSGSGPTLPVHYGDSKGIDIGFKTFHRLGRLFAFGYDAHYSFYNYKLDHNGVDILDMDVATTNGHHYFRTDNLGASILGRLYLTRNKVYIEYGIWGDFSYSKRLKIKDYSSGHKEKYKYRDGNKFNPLHYGVQGGIGFGDLFFFARYKCSDSFRPNTVSTYEPDKLSIGLQITVSD